MTKPVRSSISTFLVAMFVLILYHLICLAGITRAMQRFSDGDVTSDGNDGVCTFDMCVIVPNYCSNGEKCVTNRNTCESKCLCTERRAGKRCGDVTEPSREPQVERNVPEVTTSSTSVCGSTYCHHGNCMNVYPIGFQCICNDGWFGESCNTYGTVFDASMFNIHSEVENQQIFPNENKKPLQDFSVLPYISSVPPSVTITQKTQNIITDIDEDLRAQNVTPELEHTGISKTAEKNNTPSALFQEIQNFKKSIVTHKHVSNSTQTFSNDFKDPETVNDTDKTELKSTGISKSADKIDTLLTFLKDTQKFKKQTVTPKNVGNSTQTFISNVKDPKTSNDTDITEMQETGVSKSADKNDTLLTLQEIQNFKKTTITPKYDNNSTHAVRNDIKDAMNANNSDKNEDVGIRNVTSNDSAKTTNKENVHRDAFAEIGLPNVTQTNGGNESVEFIRSSYKNKSINIHNFTQDIKDNETRKLIKKVTESMSPDFINTLNYSTTSDVPKQHSDKETHAPVAAEMKGTLETALEQTGVDLETVDAPLNQKYNVCSENFEKRSLKERKCESHDALTCVFGVCEQTEVDHGTWTGYITVCKCDHGARGTFCESRCCLECGINGKCDFITEGDNITEHCNCRQRYTGMSCEIFVPDPVSVQIKESTWYVWIVGVCVGTFVVMVTLSLIGPYFMWKHRVILVMKIVHYFQAYEDDDEKEWDAFVSYKSHPIDESFVVDVLYPKLEQELGFKLCLHFRDFVPGETISNNIINAVEGSRRTIIILTPRYVESEFTRFEYQKAQTEMLKQKHRIIPIMLEDISSISSNMDKNLKGIVNSVTYLEWPNESDKSKKEDKFWKRLQLSLPKKKVLDSQKELSPFDSSLSSGNNNCIPIKSFSNSNTNELTLRKSFVDDMPVNNNNLSNTSLSDDADEETYFEIGHIDESLTEMIQPFTEAEEAALKESHVIPEIPQVNPYTRYMEFHIEDNPPSPSLLRSQKQREVVGSNYSYSMEVNLHTDSSQDTVQYTGNNYLEFRVEDNPPSPSLSRSPEMMSVNGRYVEFKIEDNPPSPSVIRSMGRTSDINLGEVHSNTSTEGNSPLHDLKVNLVPGTNKQYVEFKVEDNPPSPSLSRSRKRSNQISRKLPNESYTEDGYSDIRMADNLVDVHVLSSDIDDRHLEIRNEDGYTYPRSRTKPSEHTIRPCTGIIIANDGYFEADV